MFDIIIIGAGPAGLATALYALRANKKVLILEASAYGGQIINASNIENYPGIKSISGFDFATNLYNQVIDLGGKILYETVNNVSKEKIVTTNKNKYEAKCIIIATGVQKRKLNLSNEEKFIGKGLSYCATCDGNFYKGKKVAVVGGGNTAIEDAIYLSDIASFVYVIHRRDEFRAEEKLINELKNKKNVKFIMNSNVLNLNGNDYLESIDLKDNKNTVTNLNLDGLFIAIGHVPNNIMFKDIVDLDEYGYIIAKNEVCTNVDGIYVAGDARVKKLRQLTTAVSDGSIAAVEAIKRINMNN